MADNLAAQFAKVTVADDPVITSDVVADILRKFVTVEMVPVFVKHLLAHLLGGEEILGNYKVSRKGNPSKTSEESRIRTPLEKEQIRQIIDCVNKHFPGYIKDDEILEIIRVTLNSAAAQLKKETKTGKQTDKESEKT